MMNPEHFFVCPDCHTPVTKSATETKVELVCPKGHGHWPVEDAIPWFTDEAAQFEGRWRETYPLGKTTGIFRSIIRRNIHWGIPYIVEPLLARIADHPLEILDLGCGGGWAFLGCHGKVTGVDVSPSALQAATRVYERTVRACAWSPLPFADGFFDAVTSFWLAEHLEEPEFVRLLHEIRRVLKPQGHLIFLADLHSSKPILRWARSYPNLYRQYHVDRVGHYGLRSLRYTRHLLRQAGYVEQETIAINKSCLLQPVTALWMFDNDLGRKSKLVRFYVRLCSLTQKSAVLRRAVYILLMEYHRLLDRHLRDSYAFSAVFDWKPGPPVEMIGHLSGESIPAPLRPDLQQDTAGGQTASSARSRRPVAVIVDNVAQAFPQLGLAQADTIFQAPVEGLQTRLLAVYSGDLPPVVGPVRSARPYFMAWAAACQPFFIHCGASPQARALLQDPDGLIGIELRYRLEEGDPVPQSVKNADATSFDLSRKGPHFVFALPEAVFRTPETLSVSLPASFRSGGQLRVPDLVECNREPEWNRCYPADNPAGLKPASCVELRPQPRARFGERFVWDSRASGFRRAALFGNRVIHGSESEHLVIRNLVVVETYADDIPNDDRGRLRIRACGDGPGVIWRGGRRIEVTWRKSQPEQPMRFFDSHNQEVLLHPGLTWIYFMGPGGDLRIR